MSSTNSVAVWIDRHQAHLFHIGAATFDESNVAAPHHLVHRHPKGPTEEHHHPDDLPHFFRAVVDQLGDADQILIVGPSTAKLQFFRFLHEHARAIEPKVVGIETVDHPTDRQVAAFARHYFKELAAAPHH